jgi:hypothetical protein
VRPTRASPRRIFVTEGTAEKHFRSTLTKLDLPESDTEHWQVLAVSRSSMPLARWWLGRHH